MENNTTVTNATPPLTVQALVSGPAPSNLQASFRIVGPEGIYDLVDRSPMGFDLGRTLLSLLIPTLNPIQRLGEPSEGNHKPRLGGQDHLTAWAPWRNMGMSMSPVLCQCSGLALAFKMGDHLIPSLF